MFHKGEKSFRCEVWEVPFTEFSELLAHQRIHTGEKQFMCEACNKCFAFPFTQSSTLRAHQCLHTGEKPFKCSVCNKCFARSSGLVSHSHIHTIEKQFACEVCGKSFLRSLSLFVIFNPPCTQADPYRPKPFKRKLCNKSFSQLSSLRRHQCVHSVEKSIV
ncbi:gastrula zinc finger protein XlCGF71.1-like [Rhincodon typus]|uniref:gastrula zinc finger protein XlCGF71.1-like n=1 Tax=Rhincodon typus TaxID=259920 RepID=UPI0009A4293C|nr:gastrula zinc finger protein XlCGF71.1-like [Rhincodon typus]